MSFDITDDGEPEIGAQIAQLHKRSYEENQLVADVPSFAAGAVPTSALSAARQYFAGC
ncbi:hypothetical protein [Micromonospora sp. NPDC005203]|uniref:hypothetical protein n=1 Tax=Micromonospora sp. NPDC005203 TaxID=3364226 RepID=UPI0036AA5874